MDVIDYPCHTSTWTMLVKVASGVKEYISDRWLQDNRGQLGKVKSSGQYHNVLLVVDIINGVLFL